ncbi:hypothetical protein COCNU_scaffold007421G000020 [Cocos nucifera]|nr:hypothetical protein [Cocos nucifera]
MLTKSLYAHKRKEKALDESPKRTKVGASSSAALVIPATSIEVVPDAEAPPITEVGAIGMNSMPPASSSLHAGELVSKPPTERKKRDDKKKKKSTIIKIVRKACLGEPSDGSDDLGEDSFKNSKTIQDLTNKFAMPEVVDCMADLDQTQFIWSSLRTFLKSNHQIFIHIKRMHRQEAETLKAKEDLQVEIDYLKAKKAVEVECFAWEKAAKVRSLQDVLQKEEFILLRLKAMLALEEERRKEVEIKVIDLEARMVKLILQAMARTVEEFKASFEIRNLNIAFGQQAFIKSFKLCEGRVVRKFFELDLGFLEEEDPDKEAGPSDAAADPTPIEPTSCLPEFAMEMLEPTQKSKAAKSILTSPVAASPEVKGFE